MKRIRVLLLDDHILFREGLSRLLQSEPDFEIVGVCGTSAEAIEILSRGPVDVVLLDFDLGEDHGSRLITAARGGGYTGKILMVTAGMSAAESSIALKLGASGIFLKHSPPDALVNAIRLVVSGVVWSMRESSNSSPMRLISLRTKRVTSASPNERNRCFRPYSRASRIRKPLPTRSHGERSEGDAAAFVSKDRRTDTQSACSSRDRGLAPS